MHSHQAITQSCTLHKCDSKLQGLGLSLLKLSRDYTGTPAQPAQPLKTLHPFKTTHLIYDLRFGYHHALSSPSQAPGGCSNFRGTTGLGVRIMLRGILDMGPCRCQPEPSRYFLLLPSSLLLLSTFAVSEGAAPNGMLPKGMPALALDCCSSCISRVGSPPVQGRRAVTYFDKDLLLCFHAGRDEGLCLTLGGTGE